MKDNTGTYPDSQLGLHVVMVNIQRSSSIRMHEDGSSAKIFNSMYQDPS
jgi:hypothetical protein